MSAQTATPASGAITVRFPAPHRRENWSEGARRNRAGKAARQEALDAERVREQEALIMKLMVLVKRIAVDLREHLPAHVEVDDLVSAGTLGLIDAVRRFEAGKQVKIETYARYRIRGAMLDSLRGEDPASRDLRRKNKQAEQVFQKLAARLGRTPTDAEIADELHVSLDKWYGAVNQMQCMGVEWLRPTKMGDNYTQGGESLPDQGRENQFDLCYRREKRDLLQRALENMSERERRIISLYYEQDFTMKQIADELGVDESRVSQIHTSLLGRLKKNVRSLLRAPAMRPQMEQRADEQAA